VADHPEVRSSIAMKPGYEMSYLLYPLVIAAAIFVAIASAAAPTIF
jgi:hypothetical protein